MARTTSSPDNLTRRERDRLIAYLNKLQEARQRGHSMLIAHARFLIETTISRESAEGPREPAKGNLDNDSFGRVVQELQAVAEDLDNLAHLLRPFVEDKDCVHEWSRFGEQAHIIAGQREVIRDTQTWEHKVIQPMQEYHDDIIAKMKALRRRLCRAAPKGEPGRPRKYPKTLALAVGLRRRGKPWKEVWKECKKKSEQEGEPLPRKEWLIRRVQDFINKANQE